MISIIIPVYNVENYIVECLDSVAYQTYKDFEVLLIDDGSTDRSSIICDEYSKKDNRFKVFHKENEGLSSARNYGLERVSGEYIFFVDSDDVVRQDALEILLSVLESNELEAAFSPLEQFFDGSTYDCVSTNSRDYIALDSESCLKKMLMSDGIGHEAPGKLYKASLWKNVRFPVGKLYEDFLTTYYIVENVKKLAILKKSIYLYRQRKNSIMHVPIREKELELLCTVKKVTQDIKKGHPCLSIACRRMCSINYLKLLQKILYEDEKLYKEEQDYIVTKNRQDAKILLTSREVRFVDKVKITSLLIGKPVFKFVYRFSRGMQ